MRRALAAMIVLALCMVPRVAGSVDVESEYAKIKKDYQAFLKEGGKKVFRHNWQRHIDRFTALQKRFPKSGRADDALYMAGQAYVALYAYSFLKDDLDSAVELFDRLARLYPKSNLADDALVAAGAALEKQGRNAEAWTRYDRCASAVPKGDLTPTARTGAKRLAKYAPKSATKTAAKPSPTPTRKVESKTATKHGVTPKPPVSPSPVAGPVAPANEGPVAPAEDTAEYAGGLTPITAADLGIPAVTGVDHWTNPDYTRIVITLSAEVPYTHNLLEQAPGSNLPRRLYIDFSGTQVAGDVPKETPIADGLLERVRVGQFDNDTARVVLDIASIDNFEIFPMIEPYRIVIDVQGKNASAARPTPTPAPGKTPAPRTWLVVLDPGHGGKDTGAMSRTGVRESHLTLAIAKKVDRELRKGGGIETIITRDSDYFITLPQRPAIANKAKADLFVSIHINAARNREAYGIETFHFAPKARKEDYALVAAENATAEERVDQINAVLTSIALSYKKVESNHLATLVQNNVLTETRRATGDAIDRRIHSAPFYVLLGAKMPAILVECGFITNKKELGRLTSDQYQDHVARGIADGIREYLAGYHQ